MYTFKKENSWRDHQTEFILRRRKKTLLRRSSRIAATLGLAAAIVFGGFYVFNQSLKQDREFPAKQAPAPSPAPMLAKPAVKAMARDIVFLNTETPQFSVSAASGTCLVRTRLDANLQTYLVGQLDRLKTLTRGKPQRIAMVAMDGNTGFIKAMTGFDLADAQANPCTASDYPAASIFKIITAAAAVDDLGYSPDTPLYFNGDKYTLYKRQLTERKNRYTTRVTLAEAFADSINPVFGKLGQTYLGRERLNTYAHGFGFNQDPDADFDFSSGAFAATESDYHLAELGCGFNRKTQISPVFGAVMVSAIVNNGQSLVPRMIDQIDNPDGEMIYKSRKDVYKTPIQPQTADTMLAIMGKTISRGTARKAFRGYRRDKILSQLILGGKTGSLYNNKRTVKYDWFTGFGRTKDGSETLVVSVVVGHRKYIGTRASVHAKNMLKTYFKSKLQNRPGTQK